MDMLIATAIAVVSHSLFFLAGLVVANHYNDKAEAMKKDALERQFLRLRAHADADDPCKPYGTPQVLKPLSQSGPIDSSFMDELQANGKAKTSFKKSDVAKPND